MQKQEPKEGDEQLGIITEIREAKWYWILDVPVLPHSGGPPLENAAYIPRPDKDKCPVAEQQICMFRLAPWRNPTTGTYDSGRPVWQPVLDYFES